MNQSNKISARSDSLIDLLAAQCSDLERLLSLARRENDEARRGNFESLLEIVTERAKIGERLEIYGRQIAELREFLQTSEPGSEALIAQITGFAALTLEQDRETEKLLICARDRSADELKNLQKGQHGVNVYLHGSKKGLAYSRSI